MRILKWAKSYSLRTFLLTVIAIAVLMALLGHFIRDAAQQREIITNLTREGAYAYGSRPGILDQMFGKEYSNISKVSFLAENISDETLELLSRLPDLELLGMESCHFNNATLAIFKDSPVKYLSLDRSNLTDEGLEHLANLPRLVSMSIAYTSVTAKGVHALARSQRLQSLQACGVATNTAFFDAILKLSSVDQLALNDCQISASDLKRLSLKGNLVDISLNGTGLTDEGLAILGTFPKLRGIKAHQTNITPSALTHFRKLHPSILVLADGVDTAPSC